MKKERSFRPPQVVLDSISQLDCSQVAVNLNKGAIPLSDLKLMHAFLRSEAAIAKADQWNQQGGNEGLRWSRRVLRQEGVLKASASGDVTIPELVDIQLGPHIVAAFSPEPVDDVAKKLADAGIPSSIIDLEDGTLAFFAARVDKAYEVSSTASLPVIPVAKVSDITVVDESRNRVQAMMKAAGNSSVGVSCEGLVEVPEVPGLEIADAYLLKSTDYEQQYARVLKVDDSLRLVLGWAIICKIEDQPYFDTQGDYVPESSMLEASVDFMVNSQLSKDMHVGGNKNTVVFAWPMTAEIAKAFGITVSQTGLMIALRVDDDAILEKFRDGTYTGFSIGGSRIPEFTEEVVNG